MTVVPYNTDYKKIKQLNPDGIFLSKGPGNPKNAKSAINLVKKFQGKIPIFGISLGMEIIALANDLEVKKMKIGHRGSGYPVKNTKTNKIFTVNQNHGYVVKDFKSKKIKVSYRNVIDNTIEGIDIPSQLCYGVQYYPDSIVNPKDCKDVIKKFTKYMDKNTLKKEGK